MLSVAAAIWTLLFLCLPFSMIQSFHLNESSQLLERETPLLEERETHNPEEERETYTHKILTPVGRERKRLGFHEMKLRFISFFGMNSKDFSEKSSF